MLLFNLKDLKQNYKIVNVIEIDANHIDENRKNASLKQNKNKTYVYLERKSFIFLLFRTSVHKRDAVKFILKSN